MDPQNQLVELFAEFIRLRQAGYGRDAAWHALQPRTSVMDPQDVTRLHALLRGWEAREGRHYQPAGDINRTPEQPYERVDRVRTEADVVLSGHAEDAENSGDEVYEQKKHLIRRIQPQHPYTIEKVDARQAPEVGTLCPACFEANRPGELYCAHCGCLMEPTSSGIQGKAGATRPVQHTATHGTYFGDGMAAYIKVRGATEPLRVVPLPDIELALGRTSAESAMVPDVDLTPYNAQSFGVSRLHASLKRVGNTVVLNDMGSLNYTFVNGQRLHAHEVRVLSDGDQIRLGHLLMQIYFKKDF